MSFPTTTTDLTGFQGWWWGNSTSTATEILCPTPQTVYTSGTFLDCVSTGISVIPTACDANILQYSDDQTISCVSPASCYTMTVAETNPPTSPTTRYMCARSDWTYDTIYREYYIPTSVLATMSSTATQSTTFATTTSATAASTSSSDSNTDSTSNRSSSSLPGGSIAGIVVGCLAGGAIIMALFFYRADRVYEIGTSGVLAHEMHSKDGSAMPTKQVQEVHEMDTGKVREVETDGVSDE